MMSGKDTKLDVSAISAMPANEKREALINMFSVYDKLPIGDIVENFKDVWTSIFVKVGPKYVDGFLLS